MDSIQGKKSVNLGGDEEHQKDDSDTKSSSESTKKMVQSGFSNISGSVLRSEEKVDVFIELCFRNDHVVVTNADNESGRRLMTIVRGSKELCSWNDLQHLKPAGLGNRKFQVHRDMIG
ncbi:hypothetical protein V6N13_097508 [Hibiscus sabdariffa]